MTGKKLKVALCLSGEPRSSMFCFPYIYESFINLGSKYEVDVYIHSWKNFRALPLYNPKKISIEPSVPVKLLSSLNSSPYSISSFRNYMLMHYSIGECFNLIDEPYDIYIRCRLDLIFESKLILSPIFYDILNNKYDIFSLHSDFLTKSNNGVDDQVLISNFKGAKILSQCRNQFLITPIEYFNGLVKKFGEFTAEAFFKDYLDKQDIRLIHSPLSNYRLVRNTEIQTDQPFNFLDQ